MSDDNAPRLPSPGKPRKRRRWLKILGVALLIVFLLIVLAPTIASTGLVRGIILARINDNLNGHIEVGDWSLGWFSGVSLRQVKVFDAAHKQIAQLDDLSCGLSLLKAIGGRIELGDVKVQNADITLIIDKDGRLNWAAFSKPSHTTHPPGPVKTPFLSGTLELINCRGTFENDQRGQTVIGGVNGKLAIPDLSAKPIEYDLTVEARTPEQSAGQVKLAGLVRLVKNGAIDPDNPAVSGTTTIDLDHFDLSAIGPALIGLPGGLQISGSATGQIKADLKSLATPSAQWNLTIASLQAGGDALGGDSVRYSQVTLAGSGSLASIDPRQGNLLKIDSKINADGDTLSATGSIPQNDLNAVPDLLMAIIKGRRTVTTNFAGGGSLNLAADFNAARLINQLPHAIILLYQGVTVTGGRFTADANVKSSPGVATFVVEAHLAGIQGTRRQTPQSLLVPIALSDVNASGSFQVVGGAHPDLTNMRLDISSPFVQVACAGQSLENHDLTASIDLDELQKQANQFMPPDELVQAARRLRLAGQIRFQSHAHGDANDPTAPIVVDQALAVANLRITGLTKAAGEVIQPKIDCALHAEVRRGDHQAPGIDQIKLTLKTPTIDLTAGGGVDLDAGRHITAGKFSVAGNVDAARTASDFKPLLAFFLANKPADQQPDILQKFADDQIVLTSGTLTAKAGGTFDGANLSLDNPATLSLSNVILEKHDAGGSVRLIDGASLAVTLAGNVAAAENHTTVNLSALAVALTNNEMTLSLDRDSRLILEIDAGGGIRGSGHGRLAADLPALMARIQALKLPALANLPRVIGGLLNGSIQFDAPDPASLNLSCDLPVTGLVLQSGDKGEPLKTSADIKFTVGAVEIAPARPMGKFVISALDADFPGIVHLTQANGQRIVLTDVADPKKFAFDASFTAEGDLQATDKAVACLTGQPLANFLPSGHYLALETVKTEPGVADTTREIAQVTLTGVRLNELAAGGQPGKLLFDEDEMRVNANVLVNDLTGKMSVEKAHPLIVTTGSGALGLNAYGSFENSDQALAIDGQATVNYDAQKLWPIVHNLITLPGQSDPLADMKIAGKFQREFTVSGKIPKVNGALPAGQDFNKALKNLTADGQLSLAMVDTNGFHLENIDVPVSVAAGVATFGTPSQPITCNGGVIDLGNITLDMTAPSPLLSMPDGKKLLQKVEMNPVLSKQVLGIFTPLFNNPKNASGTLNLTFDHCRRLPMGTLVESTGADNDGSAAMTLNLQGLKLSNSFVDGELSLLHLGGPSMKASITDGKISVAHGVASSNITLAMSLVGVGQKISMQGNVILASGKFDHFTIVISPDLLATLGAKVDIMRFASSGLTVPLEGTLTSPQADILGTITQTVGKNLIQGLFGGGGKGK